MLTSLTAAVSGLQAFQESLDVIGNNIANSNTVGFKAGRVNFADALSQTLQAPTMGSATSSGTSPVQIGAGVQPIAVHNEFTQGAINPTGIASDLAISGEGFFEVKDSSGATFVTRSGQFRLDSKGYLVTDKGMRVQGYTDSSFTTTGDIQIDGTGSTSTTTPAPSVASYKIDSDGKINVTMSDNSIFPRGQVLLVSFQNPQSLVKAGNSLYSGIDMAGPLVGIGTATPADPGSGGLGKIQSQALEMSNVDLTSEFANMITSQRAFQANARMITTSDEMLQEVVNLKR